MRNSSTLHCTYIVHMCCRKQLRRDHEMFATEANYMIQLPTADRNRPDIRLQNPVPAPAEQNLPDFCFF